MNNKLIKTNSLWYKIKTFFKNIFLKKKTITKKKVPVLHTEQASNNITFEHSLKEKFEHIHFAEAKFSADNAAGTAYICERLEI